MLSLVGHHLCCYYGHLILLLRVQGTTVCIISFTASMVMVAGVFGGSNSRTVPTGNPLYFEKSEAGYS